MNKRIIIISISVLAVIIICGYLYLKSGHFHSSQQVKVTLWRWQLKLLPNNSHLLKNLASTLQEDKEFPRIQKEYHKILKIKEEGLEIKSTPETEEIIQGIEEIMGLYEKAIEVNPKDAEAYYNLGKMHLAFEQNKKAVDLFEKAINANPAFVDAHVALGDVYRLMGDHKRAVSAYERSLRNDPKNEENFVNVILSYNETLKSDADNTVILKARNEAFTRLTELINNQKDNAKSYYNLGYLYSHSGDAERAISAYLLALDLDPNDTQTLFDISVLYKEQGHLKSAVSSLNKLIEINPKYPDAYLNLGMVYGRMGNFDKASTNLKKALEIDSANSKAYFNLAYIFELEHNFNKSIELYKESIKYDPRNADAYYNLGNVYLKMKNEKDAIAILKRAVGLNPNHMDAWINLSMASFTQGDFQGAVEYCDEAVLLGYSVPPKYEAILAPYRNNTNSN